MATNPFQNFMVRYGANERIFTEADLGTTMYIVQSGKVRLFRVVDGQKRVHGMMEKGDFFGEMSILEGLPRTISAEAVEDAELIEINSMTFDKMIKGNIEIAIRMLRKLSIRLRETERRLEGLQADGRSAAPARPASVVKVKPAGSTGTGTRFEVDGDGTTFSVQAQETLIGRFDPVTEQMPDIDLTQVDLKRSVSRRHARLVRTDDGFVLTEEIGALNGTFVNSTKLVTGRAHAVNDGDRVSIGMVKLVFRA
jgi:CRP/FNR family cyclic AMP-dependent transcriptional regulator